MLGLGPDREVLRIHLQRRLFLAGAHPARPRHPRRLRPAQVGDRKALGPRAPGATRHGDVGLADMLALFCLWLERFDDAIQTASADAFLDCFAALAMTAMVSFPAC